MEPGHRSNTGLIAAIVGIVVVAAGAIVAIVLLSRSGGDSSDAGDDTFAAVSTPPAISTAHSAPASTVPAPSVSSSAAALTCASLQNDPKLSGRVLLGGAGTLPIGADVPTTDAVIVCSGTTADSAKSAITLGAWSDVTLADFVKHLRADGWSLQNANGFVVATKSGARFGIVMTELNGNLIAIYGTG